MTIELNDISYAIDSRTIFQHVNGRLDGGCMIALTGPSGCGKTSLLNIASLLCKPSAGDVVVDGAGTSHWNDRKRRLFWKNKASFIYQDYGLIDDETVLYNLTFKRGFLQSKKTKMPRRLSDLLAETGMLNRVNETAAVLSGGEKQRIAIVRALWKRSAYIFADEPTASLDAANRKMVVDLLKSAVRKGACVVVSTHDLELANVCDQVIDLSQ